MYTGNSYPNTWHGVSPWGVAVLIMATGQDQLLEAGPEVRRSFVRAGIWKAPVGEGKRKSGTAGASESLGSKFMAEGQVGRKE